MSNIYKTFREIADERVDESCDYLGIELIEGKPKMKTFKEILQDKKHIGSFLMGSLLNGILRAQQNWMIKIRRNFIMK
jgi:hypothetical protein